MRIRGIIDYNAVTEEIIINLIDEAAGNIITKYMTNDTEGTYNRVSSPKKIIINNLEDKNDEIDWLTVKYTKNQLHYMRTSIINFKT